MSRKGNCFDNAPIESFFHLLKTECLMDFHSVKILENSRKSQRITSIGLTIDEYHRKQKAGLPANTGNMP